MGSITETAETEDDSDIEIDEAKPVRPALTKIDSASQDMPEAFIPDISIGEPELTTKTAKGTVIQFARMAGQVQSVRRVLRKVLEADKVRRRKVLKIYLKAITFLNYMLKAHDRYGSAMMTTGMYMPR